MYITLSQKTLEMVKPYVDDIHCVELLQFFGKYSNARFNRLAIIHGLYNGSAHSIGHSIEKALKRAVDDKLIRTLLENGINLYSLTPEKSVREMICEFANVDSLQLKTLQREKFVNALKPKSGEPANVKPQLFPVPFGLQTSGFALR
jgi:hypothetical protein